MDKFDLTMKMKSGLRGRLSPCPSWMVISIQESESGSISQFCKDCVIINHKKGVIARKMA